ncbi:MAG: hypothetical protein JXA71_14860 [Chitinispirillaceae bacterium]|nr:hypothetical protein [Chitinispirillaceae bacterium]
MKSIGNFIEQIHFTFLESDDGSQSMQTDPTFRDFLRFVAIQQSLQTARIYENLAEKVFPEEQKYFFSDMTDLKHSEIECLLRYRSDGRIVSLETKNPMTRAPWPGKPGVKRFATLQNACRFAMNKELETYCLYLRLADLEEELVTKRLFLFLVRLQKCSLNYVQNRLQLIANPQGSATPDDAASACTRHSFARIA